MIFVFLIVSAAAAAAADDGVWGTFRPGLYAGVKARRPESPLFGIMFNDALHSNGYDRIFWFLCK
jgi:hypothetical protein